MSTVYWLLACSVRRRLASSLLDPPRYWISTPKAFLKASGTFTRASGLAPVASTIVPSFFAPAIQLSHCCFQSDGAPPEVAGGALVAPAALAEAEIGGAALCPQAARAAAPSPATAMARNARRFRSGVGFMRSNILRPARN